MAEQDLTLELIGQTQLFIGTRFILEIQCADDEAIARRIVVAVNACKGIETAALEDMNRLDDCRRLSGLSGSAAARADDLENAQTGQVDP